MKGILFCFLTLFTVSLATSTLTEEQKANASRKRQEALQQEINCMAKALYYEANNQPTEGIRAVYEVVKNRAAKKNTSWCAVISERRQFSFLNSGKISLHSSLKPREKELYNSVKALDNVLSSDVLFYHADYVKPVWAKKMKVEKRIGSHIFYRLKENK